MRGHLRGHLRGPASSDRPLPESHEAPPGGMPTPRWRDLILLWSVPGLLHGLQAWLFAPDSTAAWRILLHSIPLWWPWVPLTPCVLWLAQRLQLFDRPKIWAWVAHLAAAVAATALHAAVLLTWSHALAPSASPPWSWTGYAALLTEPIVAVSLSSYLLIICGHRVLTLAHALHERKLQEVRLLGRLAEAEIRSLRMQLKPERLAESFEAISDQIRGKEFDDAERAIGQLAGELRETLRHGDDLPEVWSSPNLERGSR